MPRQSPPQTFSHRALMPRPLRRILEALPPFANWNRFYGALSYLRSTLWVVPLVAVAAGLVFVRLLTALDRWIPWDLTTLGVDGAKALFQTVITLTLTFMVFTFGSLLVAIQIAGGQLTPRIIATTLLRDRVIKYAVGLNVFSMLVAISALNRTEGTVFELVTVVVALLGIACLAAFLFLIDYSARLLRPVRIVALVCEEGMQVVRGVYPQLDADTTEADAPRDGPGAPREPARVVVHTGRSQVVLAVDLETKHSRY